MKLYRFADGKTVELLRVDKPVRLQLCVSPDSSWVDENLERCYQLMETHDRTLLDQWMANWIDLVDFEVHPVVTSQEAAERIGPRL